MVPIAKRGLHLAFLIITCGFPSSIFSQGSLTPPGPPAPTMKSLNDIDGDVKVAGEKRIDVLTLPGDASNQHIISAPGSYYLSGNLVGVTGKNGISIQAGDVRIYLNGYHVAGVGGSLSGIVVPASHRDIAISHGSISQWGGIGADLSQGLGVQITDINCSLNTGTGISVGDGSVVTRCVSRDNSGANFVIGNNATVSYCAAVASSGSGGMNLGQNCTLSDCVASQNTGIGITTGANCMLRHTAANQNGSSGLQLGMLTQLENCVANSNSLDGIFATDRNVVSKCTAYRNGNNGIRAEFAPVITDSFLELNGVCGILVDAGGAGTIRDNSCLENGSSASTKGAGIRVTTAGQCRIERNVASFNYYGIDLQTVANVVVMTTATANTTNYNFVVGNHYGPIIDDTAIDAVSAPAVAGLSAAGNINSTSPWANFSH